MLYALINIAVNKRAPNGIHFVLVRISTEPLGQYEVTTLKYIYKAKIFKANSSTASVLIHVSVSRLRLSSQLLRFPVNTYTYRHIG
jgi:hypothetical protein